MSVRKTAARSGAPSGGVGLLKSLGFWALLAGASFIVGLFILSPLINKANDGARAAAPAASSGSLAPAPTPTAGLNTGSASRDDRRADSKRRADTDVQITPDAPADGGVQKPTTVDDPAQAEYRERRAQMERSLGDSGARPSDSSADTGRAAAPDAPPTDAQSPDSPDHAVRSSDTAPGAPDADSRPRRRHRGHRDGAPSGGDTRAATGPGDSTGPAPAPSGTDVQRGDTIDR